MSLSKNRISILRYLSFLFLIALVIVFFSVHAIAPRMIVKPPKNIGKDSSQRLNLKSKKVNVEIENGNFLDGYWVSSTIDTTYGVIILVHGIGGNKESFLGLSKRLSKLGIASVLFDNRAHGQSGGEYCTYGHLEKVDISKIVDFILKKDSRLKVGIWGNSLGGAIAIQALEFDSRISFGIIESTFTDLNQIVFDYKKRILKGFGVKFLSDYALKRAGKIAGFDANKIKPLESVEIIHQPVLIAHGNSDDNIDFKYGKQLFQNLASVDKQFVEVDGGEHFGLFDTGGDEYVQKLMAFISRNLNIMEIKDSK